MKIWMKYLMAALVGLALALAMPLKDTGLASALGFLFDLSIRIGRYALLPLVLFSVPVAVFELNEDEEFWKCLGRTVLVLLAAVAALSVVGVVVAAIVEPRAHPPWSRTGHGLGLAGHQGPPPRASSPTAPSPPSVAGSSSCPTYFLALLLGLAFSHDRPATKPVVQLFDSLSRVFYQINSFFVEFLGILIIAVTARNVLELEAAPPSSTSSAPSPHRRRSRRSSSRWSSLPAALWFFGGKKNPYRVLYGLLAPSLAALVSGDLYFSLGTLMKHSKESLGVRRRANALDIPLAAIFGRAGTALVTSTAFIVVLSPTRNLGVSPGSLLWIVVFAPFATLLVGSSPGPGRDGRAHVALRALRQGLRERLPHRARWPCPSSRSAAFLDALWAGCASMLLARRSGLAQEKESRFFI